MGKLSVDHPPKTSLEWCPLREQAGENQRLPLWKRHTTKYMNYIREPVLALYLASPILEMLSIIISKGIIIK